VSAQTAAALVALPRLAAREVGADRVPEAAADRVLEVAADPVRAAADRVPEVAVDPVRAAGTGGQWRQWRW
jgi:hypothetical protein